MPKTVSMTWKEYRRLLNATVEPDNYRDRLGAELAALRTVSDSYCRQLEDARRRLAVAGDLDRREIAVVDAELRVKVALQLAQDMYRLASEMGRSVRPNRWLAPFPDFEQLVRDAKRADSDGKELD